MLRYIEIADRGRSDWNLVSYLAIIPWGVELSAFHLVVWDVLKLWCLGEQPCRILQFCRLRMYHLPIRNGILQPGKLSLKPPEVTIIPIKPSFHPMVHHFPHCQTPCFRDIGGVLNFENLRPCHIFHNWRYHYFSLPEFSPAMYYIIHQDFFHDKPVF